MEKSANLLIRAVMNSFKYVLNVNETFREKKAKIFVQVLQTFLQNFGFFFKNSAKILCFKKNFRISFYNSVFFRGTIIFT